MVRWWRRRRGSNGRMVEEESNHQCNNAFSADVLPCPTKSCFRLFIVLFLGITFLTKNIYRISLSD